MAVAAAIAVAEVAADAVAEAAGEEIAGKELDIFSKSLKILDEDKISFLLCLTLLVFALAIVYRGSPISFSGSGI